MVYLSESIMCTWEKCVFFSYWMEYSINKIRLNWLIVPLRSFMSLLSFYLAALSVAQRKLLKSTLMKKLSPINSLNF